MTLYKAMSAVKRRELEAENAELREHLKGAASVIDREFAAALKPGAGT